MDKEKGQITMKKILAILAIAMFAMTGWAQFVPGIQGQAVLAVPSGGYVIHSATGVTNIANPPVIKVQGDKPIMLYLDWGCTNGTTGVSNRHFMFQFSQDGVKWLGPAAVAGFSPALNVEVAGPGAGAQLAVPALRGVDPVSLGQVIVSNLGCINQLRLYSVSNYWAGAASNTIYITNIYAYQRP